MVAAHNLTKNAFTRDDPAVELGNAISKSMEHIQRIIRVAYKYRPGRELSPKTEGKALDELKISLTTAQKNARSQLQIVCNNAAARSDGTTRRQSIRRVLNDETSDYCLFMVSLLQASTKVCFIKHPIYFAKHRCRMR
jgi:hypothetical protein